jgi:N-methylhydantoinase A
LRIEATGLTAHQPTVELAASDRFEPYDHVPVHFPGGLMQTPLVDRAKLGAGTVFTGPAILSQLDTTSVVPPGWSGRVHQSGAIILTRDSGAEQ